jgi:hypothetical protein
MTKGSIPVPNLIEKIRKKCRLPCKAPWHTGNNAITNRQSQLLKDLAKNTRSCARGRERAGERARVRLCPSSRARVGGARDASGGGLTDVWSRESGARSCARGAARSSVEGSGCVGSPPWGVEPSTHPSGTRRGSQATRLRLRPPRRAETLAARLTSGPSARVDGLPKPKLDSARLSGDCDED